MTTNDERRTTNDERRTTNDERRWLQVMTRTHVRPLMVRGIPGQCPSVPVSQCPSVSVSQRSKSACAESLAPSLSFSLLLSPSLSFSLLLSPRLSFSLRVSPRLSARLPLCIQRDQHRETEHRGFFFRVLRFPKISVLVLIEVLIVFVFIHSSLVTRHGHSHGLGPYYYMCL